MSAAAQPNEARAGQVFLLRDYATLTRYWRVHVRDGLVLQVEEAERGLDEVVHGMLEQWVLAGKKATMGFLSTARLEGTRAPGYSKRLLIVVNERVLGDGMTTPRLEFQKGFLARDITVHAEDGWRFHAHYTPPFVRELVRKMNFAGTLEYDPVDFIERLVEIVAMHRRDWLAERPRAC